VLAGMTTINIGDRNSEFVRRYLALEKIRIVAEDLQGMYPRKVAFMPRTGQAMVKKLITQQDPSVVERERVLRAANTGEARSERLAKARDACRVVQSAQSTTTDKPRIELFGAAAGLQRTVRTKTVEEA